MLNISVIISVFNGSELLLKCLASINNQSLVPQEVILTDDGSHEDIKKILAPHVKSYKFDLIFCKQDDLGFRLSRCKNNGFRLAKGDIIVVLDQDVITTKDYFKNIIALITPKNFVVSLPVRTTHDQLMKLTEAVIIKYDFKNIVTAEQFTKLQKQSHKETLYRILNKFKMRKNGVKFRGGCFATYKINLEKVNGFDENFVGWGNEDDDLGRRLANIGVKGHYLYNGEFSIHLYHKENHTDGKRVNSSYYKELKKRYKAGYSFCEYGISNSKDKDEVISEKLT